MKSSKRKTRLKPHYLIRSRFRGYLFSSMLVVFLLFVPVLPFLAVLWIILAVTFPRAKNKGARSKTLAVLGIVIGLGSLLAWIGHEASVDDIRRSKVAMAKSEMMNMAVNLETYYIDYDAYPPAADASGSIVPYPDDGSGVSSGFLPWLLTTPTAYTSSIPTDPFHRLARDWWAPYRYATNGLNCWIMTSNGPNEEPDVRIEDYPTRQKGDCTWERFMSHLGAGDAIEYDGSNGSFSSGDIVRVGP